MADGRPALASLWLGLLAATGCHMTVQARYSPSVPSAPSAIRALQVGTFFGEAEFYAVPTRIEANGGDTYELPVPVADFMRDAFVAEMNARQIVIGGTHWVDAEIMRFEFPWVDQVLSPSRAICSMVVRFVVRDCRGVAFEKTYGRLLEFPAVKSGWGKPQPEHVGKAFVELLRRALLAFFDDPAVMAVVGPSAPACSAGPSYPASDYQPELPPRGVHTHDGGYMRWGVGASYLHAGYRNQGTQVTISGWGMGMNMAFGMAVARNLILFGELAGSTAWGPTKTGISSDATNANMISIGPGLVYYVEPMNLYLSGALAFAFFSLTNPGAEPAGRQTEVGGAGFAGSLLVGKEWWISDNWGIGLAAMLHAGSLKVKDVDARMTAVGGSLLLSATYN
jgi:hypothetical protein